MLFGAEFGTGQVLWSIFWFFLFFVWISLVFRIFGDIIRSDDLSGVAKAGWSVVIIFVPYLGIFGYLIARGDQMAARELQAAQNQEEAMRSYIRSAAGGSNQADQLSSLTSLHSSGKLTDEEFAAAKSRVIGA